MYGQVFRLRTDHASLRWLSQRKEPSHQVARWLEIPFDDCLGETTWLGHIVGAMLWMAAGLLFRGLSAGVGLGVGMEVGIVLWIACMGFSIGRAAAFWAVQYSTYAACLAAAHERPPVQITSGFHEIRETYFSNIDGIEPRSPRRLGDRLFSS